MADRVVVLGACGYLGRHLVRELAARGVDLVQSSRGPRPAVDAGTYVSADVRDRAAIARLVDGATQVYVAAGLTGTAAGFERYQELLEVNELGLQHVLDAVRRQGSRAKVVFPSSRLVYRGRPGLLTESDELEARTPYALNKLAGERLLTMYAGAFGVRAVTFRIGVAYGEDVPGHAPAHGTVSAFQERAARGQDLVVYGDGQQRRSLVHIADAAAWMVAGAGDARTDGGIFNVGGPDDRSVQQIAAAVASRHGVAVRSEPWPALALAIESGDTVFDSSKLAAIVDRPWRHRFDAWLSASG